MTDKLADRVMLAALLLLPLLACNALEDLDSIELQEASLGSPSDACEAYCAGLDRCDEFGAADPFCEENCAERYHDEIFHRELVCVVGVGDACRNMPDCFPPSPCEVACNHVECGDDDGVWWECIDGCEQRQRAGCLQGLPECRGVGPCLDPD